MGGFDVQREPGFFHDRQYYAFFWGRGRSTAQEVRLLLGRKGGMGPDDAFRRQNQRRADRANRLLSAFITWEHPNVSNASGCCMACMRDRSS